MNSNNINIDNLSLEEDEIDLKNIFRTLSKYKISIILITLLAFMLSVVYAYYKPNIYSSTTTIHITDQKSGSNPEDIMLQAFGQSGSNIEDQIEITKSRFVVQNSLEKLNLETNYYTYNNLNKKTELYTSSPFVVKKENISEDIYDKIFYLKPIDTNTFRLVIKPLSLYSIKGFVKFLGIISYDYSDKISYNKVHKYGQKISTKDFTITISKVSNFHEKIYSFNFIQKDLLFDKYIKNISVSTLSKQASIMKISCQDNVALRAKHILNSISEEYISQNIVEKSEVAQLTLGFIDKQLTKINKNLKLSAKKLQEYRLKNNIINLEVQAGSSTKKLEEYKTQELELETEIHILTNIKRYIEEDKNILGLTLSTVNFTDRTISILITKLKELVKTRNTLLINFTEEYPDVMNIDLEIIEAKKSIILSLNNNLRQLVQRKSDLTQLAQKYTQSLNQIPVQETQLAKLTRPLTVNQHIYEYLLQKKAETSILKSSTISNCRIIDKARTASEPIKPKRLLIIIVGLITGLILGIFYAFLREFLITTVQSSSDIERFTKIPIYGAVPLIKNNMSKNIFLESMRAIRTNLQFLPADKMNQIISITSSVSGEGKTTISSSLAKVLARKEKKVIILDLDLRKSSVHKKFKLHNNIGLSNYLSSQNTLAEVTQKTKYENLDLISTGTLPPNPSELLLSDTFTDLLSTLREKYDYIVLDTSPAALVTDAVILMNYADISFFIVRNNYSKKDFIKNMDKMAIEHNNNKFAIIVNGFDLSDANQYGYGTAYAYGYGNSKYYQDS